MMWSFGWLNTQQHLGSSKADCSKLSRSGVIVYFSTGRPPTPSTFILCVDGRFQSYDDKVLVIYSSSVDAVAWLFCDVG